MRIVSSQINMGAQHRAESKSVKKESLEMWVGDRPPRREVGEGQGRGGVQVSLSADALASRPVRKTDQVEAKSEDDGLNPHDRMVIDMLKHVYKNLTGHDLQVLSPKDFAAQMMGGEGGGAGGGAPALNGGGGGETPPAGYGVAYDYYESHYDYEAVSFEASGIIKTQDGQEINFSVQMNMSREFYSEQSLSVRLGDAARKVDPLVVNFDAPAAQLGDTKFSFDIDSDGRTEQISVLKPGSGLLALDKNGNGKVDNGNELFGTGSGDGFKDLAAYDEDKNGFIDEGDSVYEKLRIWTRDSGGNQRLIALGEKGIGALYLGSTSTPFTYKNSEQATVGDVRSSGMFLRENGSVGTLQQIDYTV